MSVLPLKAPIGLRWRSSTAFILTTVAIGRFTDIFVYTLVLPILPFFLHDRLGLVILQSRMQSHVSGLLAVFSASTLLFSLPAGYLADWTSTRRGPYLLGLLTLILATVLFSAAGNYATLVAARILQGVSIALVNAVGMTMVIDTIGSENLGKSLGTLYSFFGVAELSSPALGGILYAKTGYQGVFKISLLAIALDFIMRAFVIEKKVAAKYPLPDEYFTTTEECPSTTIDQWQLPCAQEASNESTEESPLLQCQDQDTPIASFEPGCWSMIHCLRSPRFLVALALSFLQSFIYGVYDATLAPEVEYKLGFSALETGLLFIPLGLPNLFLVPVVGWVVDKYGTKLVATVGFGFFAPCFALFRLPIDQIPDLHQRLAIQFDILFLYGICITIISAPSIVEATHVVEDRERDKPGLFGPSGSYRQLFGLDTLVSNAGLTIGPICSRLLSAYIGYGNLYLVLAGLSAIAAIFSFVYIGRPHVNS